MNEPDAFSPDPSFTHDLCPQDARALESLCDAGLKCDGVPAEHRERARRCAGLLALLGCGPRPECDESLIDVTLVRVATLRRANPAAELPQMDEDALEALVAAGFEPSRCPAGVRARAGKHAKVLAALDLAVDSTGREARIERTLERVQDGVRSAESRMRLDTSPRLSRLAFRWGDMVSVAALLLVASAVILPMVGAVRNYSQQRTCQAGMGLDVMKGFASYANDYREALPMASASRAGSSWWNIGKPEQSNSANLYLLVRSGRVSPHDLACPGNAGACRKEVANGAMDWSCSEEISYSYQNMFARERPSWTQPRTIVVLADRSPVTVRAMRHEAINPVANSDNHDSHGQNALFNDGHVAWLASPVLAGGDNIWLPRTVEEFIARLQNPTQADPLHGNETPASATDVFLSP